MQLVQHRTEQKKPVPHQPSIQMYWNFNSPPETDTPGTYLLLTIAGIAIVGEWLGEPGEHYVGWAYQHHSCGQQ